jgi:Sulfotransferase domain
MRKPDFFIVGAPKCGTTALYRCLEAHPQVFVPERKEIHCFGTDLYSPTYVRNLDQYLALFQEGSDAKRIGEASVWYLFSKLAAAEIKQFSCHASVLIMLRNPVDMVYSLHSQHLYNGTENIADFGEALGAEADRKKGNRLPMNLNARERLFYREVAQYTDQVRRYLETFGCDSVKVIIYDDFKNDAPTICRQVFEFLNVDASIEPEIGIVNQNKRLRSKAVQSILDQPPKLVSKLARSFTTPALRHHLFAAAQELNTSHEPRRPVAPELREQLQKEFAPEIEKLSALLDRDLTHWLRS